MNSSTLLVEGIDNPNINDKKQLVEFITRATWQALDVWNQLTDLINIKYNNLAWRWNSITISNILNNISNYQSNYGLNKSLEFDIEDQLPPIRGSYYLHSAIHNLLSERTHAGLKREARIRISQVDSDEIKVQIFRPYQLQVTVLPEIEHFVNASGVLSVAILVLRQHGSELRVQPTDEGVTFEFQLPVWKEPQA